MGTDGRGGRDGCTGTCKIYLSIVQQHCDVRMLTGRGGRTAFAEGGRAGRPRSNGVQDMSTIVEVDGELEASMMTEQDSEVLSGMWRMLRVRLDLTSSSESETIPSTLLYWYVELSAAISSSSSSYSGSCHD